MTGPINPQKGFNYDDPVQFDDDSPLAHADIAKFQIGVGTTPGVYDLIFDDLTLEIAKEFSPMSLLGKLSLGQKYAAVRAVATAAKGGGTSKWSNETAFVLVAPNPNPPTGFTIG